MSFTSLLKMAGNLMGLGSSPSTLTPPAIDGEIVYCKNNVCVYPPSARGVNSRAVPGYLAVRCQDDELVGSTLILTWVPNENLRGNPRSVENTPVGSVHGTPRISPHRKKQEFSKPDHTTEQNVGGEGDAQNQRVTKDDEERAVKPCNESGEFTSGPTRCGKSTFYVNDKLLEKTTENLAINDRKNDLGGGHGESESKQRLSSNKSISVEMEGDNIIVTTEEVFNKSGAITEEGVAPSSEPIADGDSIATDSATDRIDVISSKQPPINIPRQHGANIRDSTDLKLNLIPTALGDNGDTAPKISVTGSPSDSVTSESTSGPDSRPCTPPMTSPLSPTSMASTPGDISDRTALMRGNPEALAMKHNLMFPEETESHESSTTHRSRKHCGVFSVDLSQMRSLRLFYSDEECTSGQLVIASCESQYKILHFYHGGLNKLAGILERWNLFNTSSDKIKEESNCKYFSVVRPEITNEDCHPEEGVYDQLSETVWRRHMNDTGVISDSFQLKKAIFFGGLRAELRAEVWPFLLQYYPYDSTFEDQERIRNDKYIEYQNIRKLRENMSEDEKEIFWRNIQCTVEKDVVRTDRSNPYFKGENNPNIDILKNILLNYACAHPHYGYNQGMSDLLAPILSELQHESDAYWCFEGLMQKTIFVSSPKDCDMDLQLLYLQELLRLMHPRFFSHLKKSQDGMELLFCHRWILLCFKREFIEKEAFQMWESCWAHYQTDYFHLFLCLAIIIIYGEDVIQQQLPADEMLLHFSSLALHMNGKLVLRKARGLLHQFRQLPTIPCTLRNLTTFCSHGMWDSGHVPKIQCTGPECTTGNCVYDISPETTPLD